MQKIELELRENYFQKRLWLVNEEFYFKHDQGSLTEYKKYECKKRSRSRSNRWTIYVD